MNREEILGMVRAMCLKTYNENEEYFCVKGVNGHSTIVYYGAGAMVLIRGHLVQMGRDEFKMELNQLLDITKHH